MFSRLKVTPLKIGAVLGAGALLLTGCSSGAGSAGSSDSGKNKDEVRVAMTKPSELETGFDPIKGWGCGEHVHEPLIQSTLVNTDKDMNFVNDLATEYKMADDGMSWHFKIRDDVKFSNGAKLKASDVAFTVNSIMKEKGAVCELTGVKEAVADDDTNVTIKMEEPNNTLLYTLAVLGIVPEASYGPSYGAKPIGSGRYILKQWDKGQQAIFTANPNYYGEKPKMKTLIATFMDEDPALAAARAGDVDVAYVYAPKAGQKIDGYKLASYGTVDSRGISLPTGKSGGTFNDGEKDYKAGNDVTADLAIRKALNYAVDRDKMVKNVLKGHGTPAFSVSDGMPWSTKDSVFKTDVKKAKQILADDGWKAGSDGILVKDGMRAEFDLLYSSDDSTRQALAADFANQVKQIGIKVIPVGKSWDEIYELQYVDPVLWGWGSNSPSEVYNLLYSKGWGNFSLYSNDKIDEHLKKAISTNDREESNREFQAAQVGPDGPGVEGAATWVWLANVNHLYFVRDGLQIAEQKPHPHGHGWSVVNNVDQWSWK